MTRFESIRNSTTERPELLPGNAEGTIFENDPLLKAVKASPTHAVFNDFIKHYDWSEVNHILLPLKELENWNVVYGLAKSFQEFEVAYHLRVTEETFSKECFGVIPKCMARIVKAGMLETEVKWSGNNNELKIQAEIWSDYVCGFSQTQEEYIYFVEGTLDAEGHLVAPLKLVEVMDYEPRIDNECTQKQ